MSIVDTDTGMWTWPWMLELPASAKHLYMYLRSNNHKNLACIYQISYKTVEHESGIKQKEYEKLLKLLHPHVKYDPENSIVWLVDEVKHQFMRTGCVSEKIITALSKNLLSLPINHPFIKEFLVHYEHLCIPYPYPIGRVSGYPTGKGKGLGKESLSLLGGSGEGGEPPEGKGGRNPASDLKGFLEFWAAWPNKKSMGTAERAWKKIKPDEQLLAEILATIKRAKTSVEWTRTDDDGKTFIPHPASWLNAKGWLDQYTPQKAGGTNGNGSKSGKYGKVGQPAEA